MIEGCLCLCQILPPLNILSLIVTIKTSCKTEDANFFSNFHSISIESSFGGVDFASKQKIDISCFCWQFFPLVFTHHLPMKVPVVICLCVVVFQTAKQLRHVMLGSVAVPRSLQLLSLRLKHATSRTDTTPEKKGKTVPTMELQQQKKVEFLVQVQLQTHYFSTHKGFAKKVRVLMRTLPAKVKSG